MKLNFTFIIFITYLHLYKSVVSGFTKYSCFNYILTFSSSLIPLTDYKNNN